MAADGTEAVKLSQFKTSMATKVDTPAEPGTSGQVLSTDGEGNNTWITPSEGTVYQGTAPINVSGSQISVATAGDGSLGVVKFASDADFNAYMGITG